MNAKDSDIDALREEFVTKEELKNVENRINVLMSVIKELQEFEEICKRTKLEDPIKENNSEPTA